MEKKRIFGTVGVRDDGNEEFGVIGSFSGEIVLLRIENGRVLARVKYQLENDEKRHANFEGMGMFWKEQEQGEGAIVVTGNADKSI